MKKLAFFLVVGVVLFFGPFFWQQKVLYFVDDLVLFFPLRHLIVETWKGGEIPLWNPYIFSGTPLLADVTVGTLSPFILVYLVFSIPIAMTISAAMAIFLIGWGTYLWAKEEGCDEIQALFAALIFAFSGTVMSYTNNIVITETLAWMPLVFYFTVRALNHPSLKSEFLAAVFLGLEVFSGHLPVVLITCFVLVLLALRLRDLSKLKVIAIMVTTAVLLAAVQLVPTLELLRFSTRVTNKGVSELTVLKVTELPRLVLSQIYGSMNQGNSWGINAPIERGLAETNGYLGVIPLVLTVMTIVKKELFFPAVAGVALILSLGDQTPIYQLIRHIPGVSLIRAPSLWLIVYSLFIAVAAGRGLGWWLKVRMKKTKWLLGLICFLILLGGVNRYLNFHSERLAGQVKEVLEDMNQTVSQNYSPEKLQIIITTVVGNLEVVIGLFIGVGVVWWLKMKQILSKEAVVVAVVILAVADLWLLGRGSLFFGSQSIFELQSAESRWLKEHIESYRFLSMAGTRPYTGLEPIFNQIMVREPFGESNITDEEMEKFSLLRSKVILLPPSLAVPLELPTVNGYTGMLLQGYAEWWGLGSAAINKIPITNLASERLDLSSTKYLLVSGDDQKGEEELINLGWRQVFRDRNTIFENPKAYPLAFLENQAGKVKILEQTNNKLILRVESEAEDRLVVTNVFYPGWMVDINGRPAMIEPWREVFQQVRVPAGVSQVILSFKPKTFYIGLVISLVTAVFMAVNLLEFKQRG